MANPSEERYAPRSMGLDALIRVLVEEHGVMRKGLERAREAAGRGDFDGVRAELRTVDPVFRQHIADEEATVLRLLIKQLGTKGAADEIRVFQQHRPMYQLMKKVSELASMSPAELRANQAELNSLFELHTKAEETKVFPRAAELGRQ